MSNGNFFFNFSYVENSLTGIRSKNGWVPHDTFGITNEYAFYDTDVNIFCQFAKAADMKSLYVHDYV